MATKVVVKYPRGKVSAVIGGKLSSIIKSDELSDAIGKVLTDRIKFEAKRGTPLNDTGSFKPLAPMTIEHRKYLEQFNQTTSVYKPSRSNLSFTGQLLDSIKWKREKGSFNDKLLRILIYFDGKREMYRMGPESKARPSEYNRTNEQLARTLAEIGFRVFSKQGIENKTELVRRVSNTIRSFIRKRLR